MAWIIFLLVALPIVGVLVWILLTESFVRIQPGQLGLVLVRGRATDKALLPGTHWVPAFRRRMVQVYPSLELSYRAEGAPAVPAESAQLEQTGPRLALTLGDRTAMRMSYTLRFRLMTEQLRSIHDRFGPDGLWAAVRDRSGGVLRASLGDPATGLDDLFGPARSTLEERLRADLAAALVADGFEVTMFGLGDLDLGRTGDVVQATARARLELAREQAEAATRSARAGHDVEMRALLGDAAMAMRYREIDLWRDVVVELLERGVPMPGTPAPVAEPGRQAERRAVEASAPVSETVNDS